MSEVVLWHLKVSNYNEKARWALDYKGVPHRRKAVPPGRHREIARRLWGGTTFPVLELDGRAIGESSAIVAALEERWPDPPLYPPERERAVELEQFFDQEVGPYVRRLVMEHLSADCDLFLRAFFPDASALRRRAVRPAWRYFRARMARDFGLDSAGVDEAYAKIFAAGARIREERDPSGYLVGDAFSIADLTLAALVAPAVAPVQFPYPQPQRDHRLLAPLRAALEEAGIRAFALEMYARHRSADASRSSSAYSSSEVSSPA